ncbi:MAG: PQQ-binding-like beta-propeller repeat protein [Ginsengibacter sp.]
MRVLNFFKKSSLYVFFLGTLFYACKKKERMQRMPDPPSADKFISAFAFKHVDNITYLNADVEGTVGVDTIKLVAPAETDITSLKPAITFTGKSVTPAGGSAQDFSSAVNYTVTAEDGSTKKYVVLVSYLSTVFISFYEGGLYALNAKTGQIIWQLSDGQLGSGTPSVYKGVVYNNAADGFYAVDAKTGAEKWKYLLTRLSSSTAYFDPSPVVADDVAYVAALDGYVYALGTADGSLKWKTKSNNGDPFSSSITLNNGLLYAGCEDSFLYAFNASTGMIKWRFKADNVVYVNPLVVNNNICIESFVKTWYFLDGASGTILWTSPGDDNTSSPTYDNGRIYAGGGTRGNGLDINTGDHVWSIFITPGGLIYNERSSPVIDNGTFYATSGDGGCYAYDITTKNNLWKFEPAPLANGADPYGIYGSPVLSNGLLYFGSVDGNVYAINASSGNLQWATYLMHSIPGSACVIDESGLKHYPAVSGEKN